MNYKLLLSYMLLKLYLVVTHGIMIRALTLSSKPSDYILYHHNHYQGRGCGTCIFVGFNLSTSIVTSIIYVIYLTCVLRFRV